jgi:hypothetical protein
VCQQLRAVQTPKEAGATAHERLQAAAGHKRSQERLIACILKYTNLEENSATEKNCSRTDTCNEQQLADNIVAYHTYTLAPGIIAHISVLYLLLLECCFTQS